MTASGAPKVIASGAAKVTAFGAAKVIAPAGKELIPAIFWPSSSTGFRLNGMANRRTDMHRLQELVRLHRPILSPQCPTRLYPVSVLDDETIEKMIMESFEHAQTDVGQRVLAEARVEADRILAAFERALNEDRALLSDEEVSALEQAADAVREAAGQNQPSKINERIQALDELSAGFAVRRMNRSIKEALSGQKADGFA